MAEPIQAESDQSAQVVATEAGAGGTEMPVPQTRPAKVIFTSDQPSAPQIPNIGIGQQDREIINRGLVAAQERINKDERRDSALKSFLGDYYDPYYTLDADKTVQFDMGRSLSYANMREKFERAYPQGNLISFPFEGETVLIGRKSPTDQYQRIGGTWPTLGEIATFRTLGGVVGGVGGEVFTKSPIGSVVGTGVGSLVGSELDRYIEGQKNLPVEDKSIWTSTGDAALDAAVDLATRSILRIPYGPAVTTSEKEAIKSAANAAKELGMETPLGWGQVSPAGMVNRIFRQSMAFGGPAQELITRQQKELLEKMQSWANAELPQDARIALQEIVARHAEILNNTIMASSMAMSKGGSREEAGRAVVRATEAYEAGSRKQADILWDEARRIADGAPDNPIKFYGGDVREVVDKARNEVYAQGVDGLVLASPEITGKLARLMDDITAITDNSPYFAKLDTPEARSTAFDQIKALRTRAWGLKEESEDPLVRRYAGQIFYELSKSMDNPIGGDSAFHAAYRKAADFYRLREEMLSSSYIAKALITDTPEQLMAKYFNPHNQTAYRAFFEIASPQDAQAFRAAVAHNIMSADSAEAGLKMLDSWERHAPGNLTKTAQTPGGLFTPAEKADMVNLLQLRARVENAPWSKMLLSELTNAEIAIRSVKASSGDVIAALRASGNDVNSQTAQLFRAGIINDIIQSSMETSAEAKFPVLNANKMQAAIQEWQKKEGISNIFSPADWRKLENFKEVGAVVGAVDAGMSGELAAGAAAQNVAHSVLSPIKGFTQGVVPYATNRTLGWFLAAPAIVPRVDINQTGRMELRALIDGALISLAQHEEKYSSPEYKKILGEIESGTAMPISRPAKVIFND